MPGDLEELAVELVTLAPLPTPACGPTVLPGRAARAHPGSRRGDPTRAAGHCPLSAETPSRWALARRPGDRCDLPGGRDLWGRLLRPP